MVASASRRRRETQAVDLVGPQRPRLVSVVGAGGELGANGHAFELDDEFLGRADFGQPEADAKRHGTVFGGRRGRDIDDRRVVDKFERHEVLVARFLFRGGGLFLGHQLDSHLRSPDRILAWPPATTPFFSGPFFAGPILVTRAWWWRLGTIDELKVARAAESVLRRASRRARACSSARFPESASWVSRSSSAATATSPSPPSSYDVRPQ